MVAKQAGIIARFSGRAIGLEMGIKPLLSNAGAIGIDTDMVIVSTERTPN